MFIDVHCHLDMIEREGEKDIEEVIKIARKKRVGIIVANSVNTKSNRKTIDYLNFDGVCAAMGIYPLHSLKMDDEEIDEEIRFIKNQDVVAIGEVGMDFKESGDKKRQEKNFEKFIDLSIELNVPVVVHSRKAEEKCIEILEKKKAKKVVMHCFSGKLKLVDRILENGWHLSIPTCVKHAEHFQKIVEMAPLERLFCETDSPYMHPDKEFPNTPENVVESYKSIATTS